MSYGESDRGYWTAFHLSEEHRKGTASSAEDHRLFDITHHDTEAATRGTRITAPAGSAEDHPRVDTAHHDIEAEIRGARIPAPARIPLRPLAPGLRVLPFDF